MQKRITYIVIALVLVTAAVLGVWYSIQSQEAEPQGDQVTEQQDSEETGMPDETIETAGAYVPYSEAALAEADGRKLLFFHASWCPQCRELEADMKSGTIPEGMTVFEVDYDEETDLKQEYSVTIQTTVVEVDDDGNEVGRAVAYDEPSMSFVLDELRQ